MFFVKNICFLCLCDEQNNLKNIFQMDENNISFQNKIEYCMTELINLAYEVPKLICGTCQQYLNFVYIFKQKCIENNIRLMKYIGQLKSNKYAYDSKYNNLCVSVSDILLKLKNNNFEMTNISHETYENKSTVILKSYEIKELLSSEFHIKEESVDFIDSSTLFYETDLNKNNYLFNKTLNSEEIDYGNVTNSERQFATIIESQNASDKESRISQPCQNIFEDKINKSLSNLNDSTDNASKQTNMILASDSSVKILADNRKELSTGECSIDSNNEISKTRGDEQDANSLDYHKVKRDKTTGKYHCTFCEKSYTKGTKLDIHLRKCHVEDKPFHCKVCPAKFQFRSKLNTHLIKTHNNLYQCKFCDKKFGQKYMLTKHLELHAEKLYQCETCLKKFRRKYHYTNHLTTHTGEKAFDCQDCGKKFSTKFNLNAHSRIHTGAKPYVCSVCGKAFSNWVHRRSHMDSHDGYKRYACKICPSKFTFSSNLYDHMKVVHSEERPFSCTVCDKRFKKNWHLKEHTEAHSRSRVRVIEKISCDICKKLFGKGAGLKCHMKKCRG